MTPEDRAVAAVDALGGEYLRFLADLVRCPTLLGQEAECQELIYRRLVDLGLETRKWEPDPDLLESHPDFVPVERDYAGRPNVAGVLVPSGSGGRSLVLNGHVDVVPLGPLHWWSADPWGAEVRDGRMYGRGALDMKSGLVAALLAVAAVRESGARLRGPVRFESVIEEECTGNGMLASRLDSGPVDGAVLTEPTGLQVWIATLGVLWFEVCVRGRPAYVGDPGRQVNAVERAASVIHRLKPAVVEALNRHFRHPYYGHHPRPLGLNVGRIEGGDWPSNVALECRFNCRMSFPIDWPPERAQEFAEDQVRRAAAPDPWLVRNPPRIRFNGFRARGWVAPEVTGLESLVDLLEECHRGVTGRELDWDAFPGTAD
ncbi:MAG: M20/M25/M40 family metallo-hydrolase, partial [Candidatus Aminicenantes bacterium]|nr:M20/M25/M40 family metallo-hydrolase [Candidatus Aminicenantes bacterium]